MNEKKQFSEEHKRKLSLAGTGRLHTKETKEKMRASHLGKIFSKAHRKNLSKAIKGKKSSFKGEKHSVESRKKISENLKKLYKENKIKTRKGQKCSNRVRKRMSIAQLLAWTRPRKQQSQESRKKASESLKRKYGEGWRNKAGNKKFKHGYFFSYKNCKEVYYRSSYELEFYKFLELSKNVIKYEIEPFRISYVDSKNEECGYLPDVLITYFDFSQELVEVKPKRLLKDKGNILKFEAGKKYADEHDFKYTIITEEEIKLKKFSIKEYLMVLDPWVLEALKERGVTVNGNSFKIEFYKGKIQNVPDLPTAIRQQKHIIDQQKEEQEENVELGIEVKKINNIVASLKNMSIQEFTKERKEKILKELNKKLEILARKKNDLRIQTHKKLINICRMLTENNIPAAIWAADAYLTRLRKRWLINEKVIDKSLARLEALKNLSC